MSVSSDKKRRYNTAFTACLTLIADSKWVSRRALWLWFKRVNRKSELVRRLQDEGFITCINMNDKLRESRRKEKEKIRKAGGDPQKDMIEEVPSYIYGFRYGLTVKGRKFMSEYNERRYGGENGLMRRTEEYDLRRMYRLSLLSEIRAMSELAGFSVHPHQKPPINVMSAHPVTGAGGPASSAFTALNPPPASNNSIQNRKPHQYYEKSAKRTRYGYEHDDAKQYICRTTPIGCIYLLPELISLADAETEYLGNETRGSETDQIRFSRVGGVLFTGYGSYRLYCTERTAPKLRTKGENTMKNLLDAWTANVYKGSLTVYESDSAGNPVEVPVRGMPEIKGSILFGDSSYKAAVSVLEHTFASGFRKAKEKERGINNYNLRTIKNTWFMPVIREALPLYSMFLLPHWPVWVKAMGIDYLGILAERSEAPVPALAKQYFGDTHPDGLMSDGSALLSLGGLHLGAVAWMLGDMREADTRYTVVAIEWQKPFYDILLDTIEPEDAKRVSVYYMPQSYLEEAAKTTHENYGNPCPF